MHAAVLLLADGRLPTGGHAHSSGTESAVAIGDVIDLPTLRTHVRRRLATTGLVDAAFAAAACAQADGTAVRWRALAAELMARTGSPKLREVSITLGRQLLRTGRRAWPSPRYDVVHDALGGAVPQPLVMGLVVAAAGCSPADAALVELHHLVGSLTTAAVRLLGLDPFDVAALSASLAPEIEAWAATAANTCDADPSSLPGDVDLVTDVLAEHHTTWEVRLFAS
ncbi:MAG: urease accessory protein UreF [Ilumatobacteraceae bacterium]|nr:urease accessory protein UreF [Ilumatobacteraceae bacterium]